MDLTREQIAKLRRAERMEADVMKARSFAHARSGTPVEIQRNVARFDSDAFPIRVVYGFGC